jgi:uncharacterized membrane protein (UPF0182 family)
MRAPTEMPRRRRRTSGRGRVALLIAAAVIFLLVTSLRGLAGFYTDYLWFDNLGLSQVWTGILGAKLALGAIFTLVFFVLCFVNLTVADRTAPKFRPAGPEDEMLARYHDLIDRRAWLVRGAVSLLFGLITGVGVSSEWNKWILFMHAKSFGINDATFKTDVGFYVFRLPFYQAVTQWLFAALIIILIITLVADYLNGGIRLQAPIQRVTPQVKAHLSVLLGALALVKAADYWLARYALTFSTRGTVNGATYTAVKAELPGLNLLLFIALLSAGLFVYNIWRRGWVLPVTAVGLWALVALIAGTAYPAFVQRFQVLPSESSKEAPYIDHNINATREAAGLAVVDNQRFDFSSSSADAKLAIEANPGTIRNIRLLDPKVVKPTYQRLQSNLAYTQFNNLSVDRYPITSPDGSVAPTQVVLSTRDLSVADAPQKSWEGQHIAYTHGYGLALSAANAVTTNGLPDFLVRDVPTTVSPSIQLQIDQPGVYFSEGQSGYAIVGSTRDEVNYLDPSGQTVTSRYQGKGGVAMSSWVRRAAFAMRFGNLNPLISSFVTNDSRVIYIRDIKARVHNIAPFLALDHDPYPVVLDGKVVYVMDAYTTSNYYPNAQRLDNTGLASDSGLNQTFNYVRNSVKVVVDSYDGTVKMYVIDPSDPVIQAYQGAFPQLFSDIDEMPATLREHLRYPEDLFRVQTNVWGRYHITDPQSFYEQTNGWVVAQDPGALITAGGATTAVTNANGQVVPRKESRIDPYYLLMRLPGESKESFVLLRSFVPTSEDDSKKKLTAFMVAKSDPEDYGKLVTYEMPSDLQIDGPALVNSAIQANPTISAQISLLNQNGSTVVFGNLLLVPVDKSILYVRPLYVSSSNTPVPALKDVIVVWNGQSAMKPTLKDALQELFPGVKAETFEGATGGGTPPPTIEPGGSTTTTQSTTPGTGEPNATADQLVADAYALLQQAQTDLTTSCAAGTCDFNKYQQAVKDAGAKLAQATKLRGGSATTTTTTGPPTSA